MWPFSKYLPSNYIHTLVIDKYFDIKTYGHPSDLLFNICAFFGSDFCHFHLRLTFWCVLCMLYIKWTHIHQVLFVYLSANYKMTRLGMNVMPMEVTPKPYILVWLYQHGEHTNLWGGSYKIATWYRFVKLCMETDFWKYTIFVTVILCTI